jgi:hypothetical protein
MNPHLLRAHMTGDPPPPPLREKGDSSGQLRSRDCECYQTLEIESKRSKELVPLPFPTHKKGGEEKDASGNYMQRRQFPFSSVLILNLPPSLIFQVPELGSRSSSKICTTRKTANMEYLR